MSCDVAVSAALVFASFHPSAGASVRPAPLLIADAIAAPAPNPQTLNPLAKEPLYADIVGRAAALKTRVEGYRAGPKDMAPLAGFDTFKTDVAALSALDMQGHVDLAKRGTDGDLKCILKGISQDLTKKLGELEAASTPDARGQALEDMFYLLRDNVEVITTVPKVMS